MVTRVRSDSRLQPGIRSYAVKKSAEALECFHLIRGVVIELRDPPEEQPACRVHLDFIAGPTVVVGHCGGEMMGTIDTALDTAAHIVASRRLGGR
jgi:hypothetical protein